MEDQQVTKEPSLTELAKKSVKDDQTYSQLLDIYVSEIKKQEKIDKERQKMFLMEKSFSYSIFDVIFPYHMYLGHLEQMERPSMKKKTIDQEMDYQLTTIRTFNRRRMYLIWLFYTKFDNMLTPEQKEVRDYAEFVVFKWNFIMKSTSAVMLLFTLFRPRKPQFGKVNYLIDAGLLYATSYCFLLSYVVGVYKAWPSYEHLAKKMIKSRQRIDIEKDGTLLDDFKIKFYKYDIALSKWF